MTLENIQTLQTVIEITIAVIASVFLVCLLTNSLKFIFHIIMIVGLCVAGWFYLDHQKSNAIADHIKAKEADVVNSILLKKATGKLKLQMPNE